MKCKSINVNTLINNLSEIPCGFPPRSEDCTNEKIQTHDHDLTQSQPIPIDIYCIDGNVLFSIWNSIMIS